MTVEFADQWGIHPQQFWMRGRRPERPVRFDSEIGMWCVYGHREVMTVLSDPATFSSNIGRTAPKENLFASGNLTQMDPPRHNRVRKLIGRAFTASAVEGLAPRIEALTKELLDQVVGRDRMELVNDLAYPLPVIVIAEMLGVPADDRRLFKQWVDTLLGNTEKVSLTEDEGERQALLSEALEQSKKLLNYLAEHAEDRRKRPREDLLTRLVTSEVDGARLQPEELVNFAYILLLAGHITTTMLLGNTVVCLDANPAAAAKILADPAMWPGAMEESLRLFSPFASLNRITSAEVELAGERIPADTMVMVWLGAANRDPRVFPDPDAFLPDRNPNPHLGFGWGNHFCPGAGLARLEGRIALRLLYERFPRLRTDPDAPPEFNRSPNTTGIRALPLLLTD
ncbi:MAG: cytochrome P450 [Streptosporangiaceae bacterium]|nr:cytochrome P450 [Streptosporangiaceae bacterium]